MKKIQVTDNFIKHAKEYAEDIFGYNQCFGGSKDTKAELKRFIKRCDKLLAENADWILVLCEGRCGMRKFDKGDVVLCKKFSIEHRLSFNTNGLRIEPYIDDYWFNRKAYISHTYKEYMDKTLGDINEDKDEYELRFLDDNSTLAWVSGADLILLMKTE